MMTRIVFLLERQPKHPLYSLATRRWQICWRWTLLCWGSTNWREKRFRESHV